MKLSFLGQGLTPDMSNSVGITLIRLLASDDYHTLTCFTAFTSKGGVAALAPAIIEATRHSKKIRIITGIDEKVTSKEALESLLGLPIDSYVFYQSSPPIFHSKVYVFEGDKQFEIIVGSSNMTRRGLFQNIESSLLIKGSLENDAAILFELKDYFGEIFKFESPNLKKIDENLIKELVEADLVSTDEANRERIKEQKKATKSIDRIVKELFPSRPIPKIPVEAKRQSQREKTPETSKAFIQIGVPVWVSNPLTERDLNIPKGENTNPTGSMLFKKGRTENIDQRHYFREVIFKELDWKNDTVSPHLERATGTFQIVVNNVNHGTFNLSLTHNSKKDSKSYLQKNSMTSVSWGLAKSIIAKSELIDATLSLYENPNYFILMIDSEYK